MRRYSPQYYSPPRRGYGGRGRSPPRRGYGGGGGGGGGYGRRKEQSHGSLLVRNIPLDCRFVCFFHLSCILFGCVQLEYLFQVPLFFSCLFWLNLDFMLLFDCRPEELRVPFERFGLVRDVYIPKDYYTG